MGTIRSLSIFAVLALVFVIPEATAYDFPEGPGKATFTAVCSQCHGLDGVPSYRLRRHQWRNFVYGMAARGSKASVEELDIVVDYLFANFGKADDPNKVNVNRASAQELSDRLGLTLDEAKAIVRYRQRHGEFRRWGELLVIYGVDGKKISEAQDQMDF